MEREVGEYVGACPVCARNKVSRHSPPGLLQPLPVPHRPWSDISLDFVTRLPASEGHTVVLMVVDGFSKMVHFIPLSKLPSAKEMAEVVLHHVFRIGQPLLWEPPTIEWSNGAAESGVGAWFAVLSLPESHLLEHTGHLGGICTQHPALCRHQPLSLPMCLWFPATTVS